MLIGIITIAIAIILLMIAIGKIRVSSYNSKKLRKVLEQSDQERIEQIIRAKKTVRIVKAEDTIFKRLLKKIKGVKDE